MRSVPCHDFRKILSYLFVSCLPECETTARSKVYICIYIYTYMYKLLNGWWFRTQGVMKRKDMKEFFESRDMVPISIGRFFFEIYLITNPPSFWSVPAEILEKMQIKSNINEIFLHLNNCIFKKLIKLVTCFNRKYFNNTSEIKSLLDR